MRPAIRNLRWKQSRARSKRRRSRARSKRRRSRARSKRRRSRARSKRRRSRARSKRSAREAKTAVGADDARMRDRSFALEAVPIRRLRVRAEIVEALVAEDARADAARNHVRPFRAGDRQEVDV